ncbi:carbohydrate ABC transporter permease [Streptomyces scopuliridis]|uniref:Carbohydrate ABC transporter permease n=1 Tax=Streptomyces scopuliridis TaxID=452529 RepID=A0ACD4ZXV6_9ACTN|nr:carbohydrate ABC transporter permease [Streptomyces scopuliridis]WSB38833.1 carbohydrate ABC transporter permease [Streptomyces scopuliridis]WSC03275.1 carbohydrate ABC transporter permease [Streptomyces scopuliridis]WSC10845.1 carbohydrate ABC transporter permease [Streptomyces scopuliridis]
MPAAPADGGRKSPPPRRKRRGRRERAFDEVPRWQIYLPLGLYLLFTLVPFYWMLLFSLRPAGSTSLVPWPVTFDHFEKVWNERSFSVFFQNSALIGVFTLICTTGVALAGGYALARFDFRIKQGFMLALLCSQFIPGALMLVPLFQIFKNLSLINSPLSVVIAETVFQLPLSIILISGFIKNVPYSLEEAAWVDGCSRFQAFRIVVLPMLRPGLIAVGSFAFVHSWNHFLFALMFLMDQDKQTIPVGLSTLIGADSVDFGALAAGGVISAVPVVIVFAFIQKWLITGFSAGAVKG